MKYPAELYARALCECLSESKGGHDAIIRRFAKMLHAHCDSDKEAFRAIVETVEHEIRKRQGGRDIVVTFARHQPKSVLEQFKKRFHHNDHVRIATDPSLIAGVRVTIDGQHEYDGSFAGRLSRMFTSNV